MTACYTIRADKGATVRPAPFKMLHEIAERQSVIREKKKTPHAGGA
jgi:hypothetical protein